MQKPIKYAEKAVTLAAGAAWSVFDKLNQVNQKPAFTPKWSDKPLLKS
ncbi:MAG: Fe-S protein radical family, partial [Bryobacterales bacterium]|nr:Fe-S protein radical family [Bryobacterales bacterium]